MRNCYAIILCLLSLVFCGCGGRGNDDPSEACKSIGLDSACFPKPDTMAFVPPKHLKGVNFMIETSGSMQGFMPSNAQTTTGFQQLLPDLLDRVNETTPVSLYTIFDSKSPLKKEVLLDAENKLIPQGNFKWSGNTYVPLMLDSIRHYLDPDKVSIFISDCIYSPSADNLKRTAQTIAEIREAIKPSSSGYATVILMCKSAFYRKARPVVTSPYYLVLQGKQENLAEVERLIRESLKTFKQQAEEIRLGDKYPNLYYTVLPYTETSMNFVGAKRPGTDAYLGLQEIELESGSAAINFWVGLNLDALPDYARTAAYLDTNLNVSISKGTVKKEKIVLQMDKTGPDDARYASRCNAFVRISVSDMPENEAAVTLSLLRRRPLWIGAISHDTLAVKETLRTKTFGWEDIITGFEQGYAPASTQPYFNNMTISLIKK